MIYDLQRASMLKRISAWLLDAILLCIAATLMAFLLSAALNYDSYSQRLDARYAFYASEYGITRDITQAQVDAMSPEELANLDAASKAIAEDEEALYAWSMMLQLMIIITSFGILLGYVVLEFTVPMVLGNGQTIGKKIFGIGVMRQDGVKVNGVCMFIRTVLGKYAIETMIPVMMVLMLFFGTIGILGWLIAGTVIIAEIVLLATTREHCMIHDKLANTVAVDIASQMIFNTPADLIAYKQKVAAEKAASQPY
nr:RDD family protein [Clostridia bacterium]